MSEVPYAGSFAFLNLLFQFLSQKNMLRIKESVGKVGRYLCDYFLDNMAMHSELHCKLHTRLHTAISIKVVRLVPRAKRKNNSIVSQRFPFEVYVDCPKIICTCMNASRLQRNIHETRKITCTQ